MHVTVLKYLLQREQEQLEPEVRSAITWHLDSMEESALPLSVQWRGGGQCTTG